MPKIGALPAFIPIVLLGCVPQTGSTGGAQCRDIDKYRSGFVSLGDLDNTAYRSPKIFFNKLLQVATINNWKGECIYAFHTSKNVIPRHGLEITQLFENKNQDALGKIWDKEIASCELNKEKYLTQQMKYFSTTTSPVNPSLSDTPVTEAEIKTFCHALAGLYIAVGEIQDGNRVLNVFTSGDDVTVKVSHGN